MNHRRRGFTGSGVKPVEIAEQKNQQQWTENKSKRVERQPDLDFFSGVFGPKIIFISETLPEKGIVLK